MAIYLLENCEDYQLGVWKMEENEVDLLQLSKVNEQPTFANSIRRLEYLSVRALALEMGIPNTEIAYLPSGKPYLLNSKHSISISHTKNYVAVMLSSHERIGVDLEHRSDRVRKIRHKFMHPQEEDLLKLIGNPKDETIALLLHWSAKEALFKAVPEDGVDFAQELRIQEFPAASLNGRFKGSFLRTGREFEIDYRVEPDFVLTCSFSAESK